MNTQVATQQPPTTAKVIFYTSHGQIDIQLWTKQTPLASRNFIQHCLQGYYVNTIFHRLIPGFMIQGGDPTGTGMGGQSIYGGPFKDQFHQRLKFTRRGIVAMANAGKNTNNSQFFITFGACEHLNKKHTIFGKVVGDTVYNLMGLQSLDTGEQDRPLDPPVIRKIKVVEHPFTDIKVQGQQEVKDKEEIKKVSKQQDENMKLKFDKNKKEDLKKLKNKKKLTFDDEQQVDDGPAQRVVSSHDVLYKKDASLSNKLSITKEEIQKKRKQKQAEQKKAEDIKHSLALNTNQQNYEDHNDTQNHDVTKLIQRQMHKKRAHFQKLTPNNDDKDDVLNYQKRYNPLTKKYDIIFKDELDRQRAQQQRELQMQKKAKQQQYITDEKLRQVREQQLQQYNLMKADQLNFKRAKEGSLKQRRKQLIVEEKKLLSNLEKHRYQYMQKQKMEQHEGQLFKKLMDFSSRLKTGKGVGVKEAQKQKEKQKQIQVQVQVQVEKQQQKYTVNLNKSWMNHQLKFHIDSTNAYSMEDKAMRVGGKNFEDDGGLKMEEGYNDYDGQQDEDNEKTIQRALRET